MEALNLIMKNENGRIIHLAPGEVLPGYENLLPVPDKYIDELKSLIDKLNVSTQPNGLLLGLKQIYALINRFNKEFVSTFTSCKKGCDSCCKMDVQLTYFEAEYIALATGIPHRNSELTSGYESACPFLSEKGTCSIYNYRPLLCRTYHVLSDPELCKDIDSDVMQYGAQSSSMGNFIYLTAARWIYHQTQHSFGSLEFRDIRDFFPYGREDIQEYIKSNVPRPPC